MKHIHKLTSLTIVIALVLSGCAENNPNTAADNSDTQTSVTEMSTESNYTENNLIIPDDNLLKEAAEAMWGDEVWLALNAGGNFVRADYGALSKSLMLMYIETGSTEESFHKLKDAGDNAEIADMTYEEYLEQSKQQLSEEYLSYFDDNMRLKELPNERAAVVLMSDHYDGFYSEEFIANCLRRAFEMISEDENCKKALEKAANAEHTSPEQALYCAIGLTLSPGGGTVEVSLQIRTLGEESFSLFEDIPFEGELKDAFDGGITMIAENSFGAFVRAEIEPFYDLVIYERLKSLHENSGTENIQYTDGALLTVNVDNTLKSQYIYCGDGSWYYSDITISGCRLIPDDKNQSALLADELIAHTALDILAEDNKYDIDFSTARDITEEKGAPRLDADTSSICGEAVYCYVDDRTRKNYYFARNNDDFYYSEDSSTRTDVVTDGVPYYQSSDEYEYFGNSEETYCRHEMYDIFYPAEIFEGTWEAIPLAKRIADRYTYAYGFKVGVSVEDYYCEIYRSSDDAVAVLLNDDGKIVSAWQYRADGLKVMTALKSIEEMPIDMNELLEHARTHTKEIADQRELDRKKTVDDWYKEDTAKYGLPELLGNITEGEAISEPTTVQKYLDFFGSGKPFTIEYRAIGGFRNDYNYLTTNGIDFYEKEDVSSHDNSFDYEIEEISLGDYTYMTDDNGAFVRYRKDEYFTPDEVKYHLPDALKPFDGMNFVLAYKGTINGEEYDIEKWEFQNNNPVLFFCRNEKIEAIRYSVFDRKTVFYITDYSEIANSELIRVPENIREITD